MDVAAFLEEVCAIPGHSGMEGAAAARIAQEAEQLGRGMTDDERAVLLSFLEARPSYLQAFFDEVETIYGSFDRYVGEGLRLTLVQRACLASLLAR